MFGNGRKTIGVFATQMHQEFQKILSKGICKRAKELDYNVAFFTSFLGYDELQYEIGERSIAELPRYKDFDGIIMLPDTMYVDGFEKSIRDNLKNCKCPVVSVRKKIDEYYNVLIDDSLVLDEIIQHFIVDHNYKKINFLTGPSDNPVSIERLNSFKRIMGEHNLPVEERQIFYGDFWKFTAYDAVNQWLTDPETYPEAIICANDYMAITVCNALLDRGISVPEDIAVSGCDNIEITQDFSPTISTVEIPTFEMGIEAVNKINRHIELIPQEKTSYIKTSTVLRESCGCKTKEKRKYTPVRRNHIISDSESKEKAISNNAFMSVELTSVKTLDELDNKLILFTNMNEGFDSFYMCLNKNWDIFNKDGQLVHVGSKHH